MSTNTTKQIEHNSETYSTSEIKMADYYRKLLQNETDLLTARIEKYNSILNQNDDLSESG